VKKVYFCRVFKTPKVLTKNREKMKKVMAIFGAALLLAGVATSCNKKCECKTYVAGVVTTTAEMELDKGKKCSDYTAIITEDPKTGVECKSKLF
jgi:hypothetical protein